MTIMFQDLFPVNMAGFQLGQHGDNHPITNTVRIFVLSAGAMKAMVSKDIVHRDLKPQNILLSHDGRSRSPSPQDITLKIGTINAL